MKGLSRLPGDLQSCLVDCGVFRRGTCLFERDVAAKERRKWLVLAAGVTPGEARRWLPARGKAMTRAEEPILFGADGELRFLLVLGLRDGLDFRRGYFYQAMEFLPEGHIPPVAVRHESYIRIRGINGPLDSMRWEFEAGTDNEMPREEWLVEWSRRLALNPAHPPAHYHFNEGVASPDDGNDRRKRPSTDRSFRLGLPPPNPFLLFLAVASYLRSSVP